MTTPFIIYALPRSRTAWLSKFLTYGPWKCIHDPFALTSSLEAIAQKLNTPYTGIVDTGLVTQWKTMKALVPEAKIVVVERSQRDVEKSLGLVGLPMDVTALHASLQDLLLQPYVKRISFIGLDYELACKELFEHCLNMPFDREWWLGLRNANIQIDISLGPPRRTDGQF